MPWKAIEPMNQRTEFVLKALKTDNFRALCQEYAISTKTGYKWKERFLAQGVAGMSEHSRRPNSSPEGLVEGVVCEIVRLKQKHKHWGPGSCAIFMGESTRRCPARAALSGCWSEREWWSIASCVAGRRRVAFIADAKLKLPMRCGRSISRAGGMAPR